MASIEYLTRFDSTHGRFPGEVKVDGDCLHINGDCVKVLRSATPEGIDWAALGVDLVLECSGAYHTRADGQRFLDAGAPACCFRSRWPARRMSTPPSSTASTRIA
jgi:D-erythrose 4-phosphate dehydrogenase